jgi:hypothetical protein
MRLPVIIKLVYQGLQQSGLRATNGGLTRLDLRGKYLVMRESIFRLNTCHVLERQMLFGSMRLYKNARALLY